MVDIRLREVQVHDLEILCAQQQDPEANALAGVPARGRDEFFDHWKTKILGDPTTVKRTILAKGAVAGHIICFTRDDRREVGYWLGQDYRGRGIASQALKLFFGQVTERPIYGVVSLENRASIRVLQKCGFRPYEETQETQVWVL